MFHMSWEDDSFYCSYCGEKFGKEPIKLAVHIKQKHEDCRGKLK